MTAHIGLAEAIEQLRRELGDAQDAGADQQLRFEVAEVEMELSVELRREAGAQVSVGVVAVGGQGAMRNTGTHRLTLRLKVRDEALGGRTAEVSDGGDRTFGP